MVACGRFFTPILLVLSFSFAAPIYGQALYDGNQTLPPFGGFQSGEVDTVSLQTGRLHLHIPLVSLPERQGKSSRSFLFDTPSFQQSFTVITCQGDPSDCSGIPNLEITSMSLTGGGSMISGAPSDWSLTQQYSQTICGPATTSEDEGDTGTTYGPAYIFWNAFDPEGQAHPLSLLTGASTWGVCGVDGPSVLQSPSFDGSGIMVNLNPSGSLASTNVIPATITLPNGTVIQTPTAIQTNSNGDVTEWESSATDSNGNVSTVTQTVGTGPTVNVYTDDTGKTITTNNGPWIQYTTPNGATTAGYSNSVVSYVDTYGNTQSATIAYQAYDTSSGCVSDPPYAECDGPFPIVLPVSLTLPDGKAYTFTWANNSMGELLSMTVPAGATINYTYTTICTPPPGEAGDGTVDCWRAVQTRSEVVNGQTNTWTYSINPFYPNPSTGIDQATQTTVYNPDGSSAVHTYTAMCAICESVETSVATYQGNPTGNPLQTVTTTYTGETNTVADQTLSAGGAVYGMGTVNIRPIKVTTTLDNGLVKEEDTDYETFTSYGNVASRPDVTETREYAYGQGTAGSLARRTDYTYLHDQVVAYATANIVDRVSSVQVADSSVPVVSGPGAQCPSSDLNGVHCNYTTYEYDNYTQGIQASNAVDHNSSYSTSYTLRGNRTATNDFLNSSLALTTRNQYDDAGNVIATTDPNGNTTSFSYADSPAGTSGNTDAYLTTVTRPQTYGVNHISYNKYNYLTGLKVESDDENGQPTNFAYNDPFLRLTDIYDPPSPQNGNVRPHTQATYVDSINSIITVVGPTGISNTKLADGLGRLIQTQLTSDSAGIVFTDTQYDPMGRVASVSNPYRSKGEPTYGLTSYTYDGLGRKRIETEADGSTTSWSYSGNITTFTDEAGNSWQRTSDALDHLIKVVEPGPLNTNYTYDALGNLVGVAQLGNGSTDTPRNRAFFYDPLSRLLASENPETGTGLSCPGVSGTAWGLCYSYDSDGNLASKTDARGTGTTYGYDALDRLTLKQYSDGTLPARYGYDGNDEFGNPLSVSNAVGRMSHSSNDLNAAATYSYDPMGQVISEAYCVPDNCTYGIQASANYDLAEHPTSFTYPDGRNITQAFNGAGQLSGISYASWNGSGSPTSYLTVPQSTNPGITGYDASGHLINATMGNGLSLAGSYDDRERLGALAYGTATQALWGKQYQWTANSNLQSTTDGISGVTRQFSYDNLNRLTSAQDIFASSGSGGDSGSSGACSTGSTAGTGSNSGASPQWTDPDDSNVLINPQSPGATGWGLSAASLSPSAVAAPDGTMSATVMTANSGSDDSFVNDNVASPYLYNGDTVSGSVWLRSTAGTQTLNIYLTENWNGGWNVAGWTQVQLTTAWQQVQVSGAVVNNLTSLVLQIGGGGSLTSGQSIAFWNPMLEDEGSADPVVTNFLSYSQRLTGPTWSAAQATVTDNAVTAPDGSGTGATLAANSSSTDSWLVDNVPNPAPYSGLPVTGSVWLKSTTGSQQILVTLIEVGTSGWSTLGAQTVTLNSNWQRFQVTGTMQNNLNELQLQIGGANTLTNGQSINVWGAQMELAAAAGPYVATAGVPVTMGTSLTNVLPYSQQPNGSSWIIVNGSANINSDAAPDGTQTAATLVADTGGTIFVDNAANPALLDGATVTASVYLRSTSGPQTIALYLVDHNTIGWQYPAQTVAQVTSAWQRFSLTGTLYNGLDNANIQVGGGPGMVGSGLEVWGAQMEVASTAGPYVATNSLPVIAGKEMTNILPNSQELSGPSWIIMNGNANVDSDTAPDGTQTAATIVDTGGGTLLVDNVPNPSLYDGQTITTSVYLRSTSGDQTIVMYLVDHNTIGWQYPAQATFQVTSTWQRFSLTGTLYNGLDNLNLQIGGGPGYVGTGVEVWGAQMVVGAEPAPYIPTTCTTTIYATGQPATLVPTGLNQSYSYDSFGNILQNGGFNDSYAANNQMFGYAYDAAGNLLFDGVFNTMTWDAENRMTSVGGATYIYDAEGNRVEKQGVGITDTIYFGGRPLARLSGGQWTDLIYGPNGLLAEVQGTQSAPPIYRLLDHLGNEVGTSDSTAQLINPLDYTPYGQIFSGTTTDPYLFTGKERDQESGLDYFGARYYGSTMGRFSSPDPSGLVFADPTNPQSFNLYAYVQNNPLVNADPNGLDCIYTSNLTSTSVSVETVRGDCRSDTDNGVFVNGTVNTDSYKAQVGSDGDVHLGFGYTSDDDSGGSSNGGYTLTANAGSTDIGPAVHDMFSMSQDDRISALAQGVTADSQHSFGCIAQAYGFGGPSAASGGAGTNLWNSSQNLVNKSRLGGALGGSTAYTSEAAMAARSSWMANYSSFGLKSPVGTPFSGNFAMRTSPNLGVAAGRYAPYVGAAGKALGVAGTAYSSYKLWNCL